MTESHVVSALRTKRSEIAGYIKELEKRLRTSRAHLVHIDASIKLFSLKANPEAIKPRRPYRRSGYFKSGEVVRLCLDELRDAADPVSATDLTKAILERRHWTKDDPDLFKSVNDRVLSCLRTQVKRGAVIKTGTSQDARWRLALA